MQYKWKLKNMKHKREREREREGKWETRVQSNQILKQNQSTSIDWTNWIQFHNFDQKSFRWESWSQRGSR